MPPAIQQRLGGFLRGEPLPTGSRPNVRLIATCRANLLEDQALTRLISYDYVLANARELEEAIERAWNRPERRVPEWRKENDALFVMAGFFLIVCVEEVAGMRHSPVATGFLLLTIVTGGLVTSALVPRRSICRHLCPMGRPRRASVCRTRWSSSGSSPPARRSLSSRASRSPS